MAGAAAIPGVPGQVWAPDRLPGGRARQRGGIHQAQQVMPGRGAAGQFSDHRGRQPARPAQPLAAGAGLLPGRRSRDQPRVGST
jgi:hypothetical protein